MRIKVKNDNGCHNCKYDLASYYGNEDAKKKCQSCDLGNNWEQIKSGVKGK